MVGKQSSAKQPPEPVLAEPEIEELEDGFTPPFDFDYPIAVFAEGAQYEASVVEFFPTGIFLVREGVDKVFLPWINVTKVFQKDFAAMKAEEKA